MTTGWPQRPSEVLGLDDSGVVFVDDADVEQMLDRLRMAGYAMVDIDTHGRTNFRDAQAVVAVALRLPAAAGRNLDALADCLGDLARWWPDDRGVVLAWHRPETVIVGDTEGWLRLTDVLADASERLWRGGDDPTDRIFETLVFVEGLDG